MLCAGTAYIRMPADGMSMISSDSASRAAAIAAGRARLSAALGRDHASDDVLTRYDRWVDDLWDGLSAVYEACLLYTSPSPRD